MIIKKKDFIELDFTGRIKESGQIFDTTNKEDAKKMGAENVHSLKICVGEGMLVKGFDEALEGKETGNHCSIEIEPKKAFGMRDPKLIKIVPISVFHEKDVNPYPGLMLNIDGMLVRISSVSGGRVTTDFNLPLAGKTIVYEFKIKRLIEDKEEKLKTLAEFFVGKADIKIEDNKAIISLEKKIENKMFKEKAKELLGLDIEFRVK